MDSNLRFAAASDKHVTWLSYELGESAFALEPLCGRPQEIKVRGLL